MGKRILLFLLSSFAATLTVCVIVVILGAAGFATSPALLTMLVAAAAGLLWALFGAWASLLLSRRLAKQTLAMRMLDGKSGENDADWVFEYVRGLAERCKVPMPEVGLYESSEVNAFSTGASRQRGMVAVSSGLLRNMSRQELTAVLAHEVTHIANGDMVTMGLLQGVVNAFVLTLAWLTVALVRRKARGPIASAVAVSVRVGLEAVLGLLPGIIAARFSRRRELRADAKAASLVGREHMTAALRQLARTRERVDGSRPALRPLKIGGGGAWLDALDSHPPIEERITALEPPTPLPATLPAA